ncbi:MAG: 16S rRNA (cytosine(967)-C(5))-methyltransferase RsmB [Bacillota bacterium]
MNSRKITLEILNQINKGSYSNILLDNYLVKIDDRRDRALITELVYGVLRLQNRLDYIISQFSRMPLAKIDLPVLHALRLGIYQILYLDRIPERAAVNETVNAIKGIVNRGAVGFVNGLLRNLIRKKQFIEFPDPEKEQKSYLVNYLSHPEWLVEYWLDLYGLKKTTELLKYNNEAADLTIRINTLKFNIEDFTEIYQKNNIDLTATYIPGLYIVNNSRGVENLPLYDEGGFFVQGPAAAAAGYIVNPSPGMRILDMAAAPGGKTTHLAELMKNSGEIIALDLYDRKLSFIQENCRKMGIDIVKTYNEDATHFSDNSRELFDIILLDAPCSGLGLIQQKPEIRWNKSYSDIKKLTKIQFEMMENAFRLLKPGGKLIYSTCTLTKEENEDNIYKFLNKHNDNLSVVDLKNELKRYKFEGLNFINDLGFAEFFPPDSKTEGFFVGKIIKI